MKIENLTLTNFNDRQYKVHTYILEQNPELVEQKKAFGYRSSWWQF